MNQEQMTTYDNQKDLRIGLLLPGIQLSYSL